MGRCKMTMTDYFAWFRQLAAHWALQVQSILRLFWHRLTAPVVPQYDVESQSVLGENEIEVKTAPDENPVPTEIDDSNNKESKGERIESEKTNETDKQNDLKIEEKESNTTCASVSDISVSANDITKSFVITEVLSTDPPKQQAQSQHNSVTTEDIYSSDFESDEDRKSKEEYAQFAVDLGAYQGSYYAYQDSLVRKCQIEINLNQQTVQNVEVEGSWDDWREPVKLEQKMSDVLTNQWPTSLETSLSEFQ